VVRGAQVGGIAGRVRLREKRGQSRGTRAQRRSVLLRQKRASEREDHEVSPLLPLLFCGRSGQARGLEGGAPRTPPYCRRGHTCARPHMRSARPHMRSARLHMRGA
jgi:hypothetical protein